MSKRKRRGAEGRATFVQTLTVTHGDNTQSQHRWVPEELLVPALCPASLSCVPRCPLSCLLQPKFARMGQDKDASPELTSSCAPSLSEARQPLWNCNRNCWDWECRGKGKGDPGLQGTPCPYPSQSSPPASIPGDAGSATIPPNPHSKPLQTPPALHCWTFSPPFSCA